MKNKHQDQQLKQSTIHKKINKNVGKPIGLLRINLDPPDIWSIKKQEAQLISFLVKYGRHVCLHQAVLNKDLNKNQVNSIEKEQKVQTLLDQKELYDKIEIAAKYLFEWNCSKRNVVYFFRNNTQFKLDYKKLTLKNQQWTTLLKNIKFLFNQNFYEELHIIMEQFENNISNQKIGDYLISKSITGQLSEVPQLVQNFFILLIKKNIVSIQCFQVTVNFLEQLKKLFLISIQKYRFMLYQMIGSIRNIMQINIESEQYSAETSQADQDCDPEIFFNSTSY
ncbi:unnamed protein product [Paramecium primaurelia]|uniref:Uncharacterized protein n=1 Tax=Paramecium primaurelia TaxID=5886 RepID=A0A8S1L6E9_PARPR|nr:unnamed protein product [Paramecium primaurelia]